MTFVSNFERREGTKVYPYNITDEYQTLIKYTYTYAPTSTHIHLCIYTHTYACIHIHIHIYNAYIFTFPNYLCAKWAV